MMCDYVVIVRESSDLPPAMVVGPFAEFADANRYADKCADENPDVYEIIITQLYNPKELEDVEA